MRTAFIEGLCEAAAMDPNIWLVAGDLGYSVLEQFSDRYPDRYVNVGVAEQNMIGVAAGAAACGKTVFTYSIANFAFMRCLEQIRNDVCHHHLNVKVVAVGGGVAYGPHGFTHHAIEDLAIMQALGSMTVLAPGDPAEARLLTKAAAASSGPCYLRLGRAGEPKVHATDPNVQIGKAILLRSGRDVTLISTGGMLKTALDAASLLSESGIDARVISLHTLRPLDEEALRAAATETELIATLEEHAPFGGLHAAVLSCIGQSGTPIIRYSLSDQTSTKIGTREHLLESCGLNPEAIARTLGETLRTLRRAPGKPTDNPARARS